MLDDIKQSELDDLIAAYNNVVEYNAEKGITSKFYIFLDESEILINGEISGEFYILHSDDYEQDFIIFSHFIEYLILKYGSPSFLNTLDSAERPTFSDISAKLESTFDNFNSDVIFKIIKD